MRWARHKTERREKEERTNGDFRAGERGGVWQLTDCGLECSAGWQLLQDIQPGDGKTALLCSV